MTAGHRSCSSAPRDRVPPSSEGGSDDLRRAVPTTNDSKRTTTNLWQTPRGLGHTLMADMIGYQVVATDGAIGRIDQATDEIDACGLVVDTGFWIFGKRRLIPAGVIDRIDAAEQTVHVSMTKDQLRQAPDFVEEPPSPVGDLADRDRRDHRDDVSAYFARWWG